MDHQFANHSLFTGRYTYNGEGNVIAGSFPLLPFDENVRAQQAALAYTASSAAWIDESRFSFTRLTLFDVPESAFHSNIQAQLGLADPPTNSLDYGLPFFNATDYSMVTDSPTLPQAQRDNLWQLSNHASFIRGAHTLKVGGDYLRFQMNYLQSSQARGTYTYTGAFTSADGSGVGSGDPFGDFLLGAPQETARTTGSGQAYLRENVFAVYAQDEWRLTSRLSVSFGVTFGNAGRDIGSGPGNNIFDFVLFRQFRLKDRGAVQFRAESFNAFNHPNWGIPVPNPDSGPFFGRIVAAGDPRRIQFALRYDF